MHPCWSPCRSTARAGVVVLAARQDRSGRGGGGGTHHQRFSPPQRLLSPGAGQEAPRRDTVYTLRLSTGLARGAALTDPAAGVLVCLVARDGSALLHRVPRLYDPEAVEADVRAICASIDDKDAGANCAVALRASAAQRHGGAGHRLRFQEGSVDEVSFVGPELGPLAALIVGPEQGRWLCDEVDVSSSRTGHTDRFVCRESLGDAGAEPAAYLAPVPPDSVIYGSGDSAVVVTKAQAAQLYRLNMQQYNELKGQLVAATAVLVALGSGLAYAAGGRDLALPFALGGAGGMLYQYMLQAAVDSVGGSSSGSSGGGGSSGSGGYEPSAAAAAGSGAGATHQLGLQLVLGNPAVRVALTAGSLLGAFALLQAMPGAEAEQGELFQVQQIAASLAGFLCYKAAVVGVAIIPPPVDDGVDGLLQADASSSGSTGSPRRE